MPILDTDNTDVSGVFSAISCWAVECLVLASGSEAKLHFQRDVPTETRLICPARYCFVVPACHKASLSVFRLFL